MSVGQRFSVVRTYDGRRPGQASGSLGGIYRKLDQAIKECARRNDRDPLVIKTADDVLRRWRPGWMRGQPSPPGEYRWRVLDLGSRRYVD